MAKKRYVYVVQGGCGEYEDASEWLVCAFVLKVNAEAFKEKVQAESDRLQETIEQDDDAFDYLKVSRLKNRFDSEWQFNTIGVLYWCSRLELRPWEEAACSTVQSGGRRWPWPS